VNTESESKSDPGPYRCDCPCCGHIDTKIFHKAENVPVNSVLNIKSRQEALDFPRGFIALRFCRECGFIFNSTFEPEKVLYSSDCEESQAYSLTFSNFAHALAESLVEKYDIRNKRIIEIGCGKGEFLKLLCTLGHNSGVGFDPAFVHGRGNQDEKVADVEFIKDYYSEKHSNFQGDLICCRMTLEHIPETAKLVQTIRRSIGERNDTTVFFQVPDTTRIMRDCAFEDIYYEHCSYFSLGSLARLFRKAQFDILDIQVVYGEQYILIEARPVVEKPYAIRDLERDQELLESLVGRFHERYPLVVTYWSDLLDSYRKANRRVVVWGSGSKGVAYLTTLRNSAQIEYAVDINPYRQGTFMAGTGQKIVAPEFLRAYRPDAVIIMNPVYREEIVSDLKMMELSPEIHVLGEHINEFHNR